MDIADFSIKSSDLRLLQNEDEPRVLDLRLAEALGFDEPRFIRKLIQRHENELATYSAVCAIASQTTAQGGRPGTEYWLTEAQALLICVRSDAPAAVKVRRDLILLFMSWRRCQLTATTTADEMLRALLEGQRKILNFLEEKQKRSRQEIPPAVKESNIRMNFYLGGRCPIYPEIFIVDESGQPIIDESGRILGEHDHFYSNQLPTTEHTWFISRQAHAELTANRISRDEASRMFSAYQWQRIRLMPAPLQLKLL